ncbi:MAG: PH domain-containing protein [Micrococcales bacterium]|nr:PH domain-containing protein [Micrococcales bacterium]
MSDPTAPTTSGPDPFATFTSRRGKLVAWISALVSILIFGGIAVLMPGESRGGSWGPIDRMLMLSCGLAIAWLMWRYGRIHADPDREGLSVQNLILRRRLRWDEIETVRFSGGDPWVYLDLSNLETLAVMAVQKADGPRGRAEAARLAALVQALGGHEAVPPSSEA